MIGGVSDVARTTRRPPTTYLSGRQARPLRKSHYRKLNREEG